MNASELKFLKINITASAVVVVTPSIIENNIFISRLTDSTIDSARLLAQTINLEGKFDLRVSTFGTSSGILVHCEKTGSKAVRS